MCVLIYASTTDSVRQERQSERGSPLVERHAQRRGDLLLQIQELRALVAQLELRTRRARTGWGVMGSATDRERLSAVQSEEMPDTV